MFGCGVEIGVGRGMWRSSLGIGCGDRRRDQLMGFVHLWCELFIYGSDFVGHLWVLFWRWWVMGSEAGVVCLSFVAFLDGGGGGGFSGRETEEES